MKLITLFLFFFCLTTHAKDENTFKFSDIKAVIKSSKTKYEDSYLFIANAKIFPKVKSGTSIEVLLPKSACYEEALRALGESKMLLTISNMNVKIQKPRPDSKDYEHFAILETNKKGERSLPGCKLSIN